MTVSRRQALRGVLAAAAGALVPRGVFAQQQDSMLGTPNELRWPEVAGRSRARITDYENDPHLIAIEERLRCTCGCNLSVYTCRTTDFTCVTSPMLHRQVIDLIEQGRTADDVLAAFVAQYGETVLMAPPKIGFNWAAYLLPGVVITAAGGLLVAVLRRRAAAASAAAVPSGGATVDPSAVNLSTEDARRLEAELSRLNR